MSDEYGGGGKRQQHSYGTSFFRFRGTGLWILSQPSSHVFAVDGGTPFGSYEIMVTLYVVDTSVKALSIQGEFQRREHKSRCRDTDFCSQ
ncbi:uncharacterized protein BT62DRAFT_1080953 [Guyanagaster necrorhizus]|uniref:Uncharacterized protein n=1 Tax=Guyanagaster necrorhizus TaxID=856835 RepID=A0A9P7VG51_9AGAR|nr:uncharacterized protein BT62DRAFT_1080953 [Guyanagaster necrorhizus MCA 3950]KAG7440338.1 hypothetical protein BT62DRAFT_1080953 [Guyanagaster necrorhizus MCA 3950]